MLQPEQNHKDLSAEIQTGHPETSGHLEVLSAIDSLRADMDARLSKVDERTHKLEQSMLAGFEAIVRAFGAVDDRFDKQDANFASAIKALKKDIKEIEHLLTDRLDKMDSTLQGVQNEVKGVRQTAEENL